MYFGYRLFIHYLDDRYNDLIGPRGMEKWGPQLPEMANKIRLKVAQDKWWYDAATQQYNLETCGVYFEPNKFSVAGFVDCKDWKICRPGSGPNNKPFPHVGAQRNPNWYTKQRAFFGGHHRQHGVKTLAFTLPNGLTASVFGPCSSRRHDLKLLEWSEIDDILRDFQTTFMNLTPAEFFSFYGDSAFFGPWACIRSRHQPINFVPLTVREIAENKVMSKVRQTIEHDFGSITQHWKAANEWYNSNKLECSAQEVCAKLRVLHLLQNCLVCCRGASKTSTTFGCNPPNLEDYLNM